MKVAEIDALLTLSRLSETVVLKASGEVMAGDYGCIAVVHTGIVSDADYQLTNVPSLLDKVIACGGKGTSVTVRDGTLSMIGDRKPDHQCALDVPRFSIKSVDPDPVMHLATLTLAGRERKRLARIRRLMQKVKLYELTGQEGGLHVRMQTPMKAKPGFTRITTTVPLKADVKRSFTASFNGKHLLSASMARGDYAINVYDDGNGGTVLECRPIALPLLTYWITTPG